MSKKAPERVPENSEGDFYVEAGACLRCGMPHQTAPELMNDPRKDFSECYFRRQPQTWEEILHAVEAIQTSDVGALRYGGSDPRILWLLHEKGCGSCCDRPHDVTRGKE